VDQDDTHTEPASGEFGSSNSEARLRLIADAMPALISYIDFEYRYLFANSEYTKWFGYESDSLLGRTMAEVLGDKAFEKLLPNLNAALAGERRTFESEVPYKVGGTRFILATYTPDKSPDGVVQGLFVLVKDITEQRNIEESLKQSE